MNTTRNLTKENLVNPTTQLSIRAVTTMVNSTINIVHVNIDEDFFTKIEQLQKLQEKHHIDMMLFGEIILLESEKKLRDNLSATTQVSTEVKGRKTQIDVEAKKEAHKEKTKTGEKAEKEAQQQKALIAEHNEHNQCGSTNIFNSNIDFQCVGTHDD